MNQANIFFQRNVFENIVLNLLTIRAGASTEHTSTSTGKSVLEYSVFSIFMFIILGKTSTRVVLAPALLTILYKSQCVDGIIMMSSDRNL